MRRKLAAVGASYLIGLIFASIFFNFAIFLICGVILLVIAAIAVALFTKKYGITAVLLCSAAGIAVFFSVSSGIESAAQPLLNGVYEITAVVREKQNIGNDSACFSLESYTDNGKVGMILYTDNINADKGDKLHFKASFSKLTDTAYYSTAGRYFSDGITLSAVLHSDIEITKSGYPLSSIDEYRNYLINSIDGCFPDDSGALMKAVFLGDKSSLSDELYSDIKLSGVSHLTAVSGMHLTLIMTVLMSLLSATRLAYSYRVRFLLTTVLTVCFMAFFGFTSSVLRSGIMIITANTGSLFYRKSDCLNSVGLAVLLITLFDPLSCLDAGLILSAVTTVGAGAAAPEVSKRLKEKFTRLNGRFCDTLCVSFCAALAGIPLSAVYFGTFSLAGVIVSVITVPLFTLCLSSLLIFALTGGIITPLAVISHFCCDIMRTIFSAFASVPFLHFGCEPFTVIVTIIVITVATAMICTLLKGKHNITVIITALLCFTAVNTILPLIPDDDVKILMHSDGENGSVLIRSADTSVALLIGNDEKESNTLRNELLSANRTHADTLIFCNTDDPGKELLQTAHRISDNVELCRDFGGFDSSCFRIYRNGNAVTLTAYNTAINISDISSVRQDMPNILWGKSNVSTTGVPCFFFNRYQKSTSGISLYYTECEITINSGGMTVNCNYR